MDNYEIEKVYKKTALILIFGLSVFIIAGSFNWFNMALQNPEQVREDLGDDYLAEVILYLCISMGAALFVAIFTGTEIYRKMI